MLGCETVHNSFCMLEVVPNQLKIRCILIECKTVFIKILGVSVFAHMKVGMLLPSCTFISKHVHQVKLIINLQVSRS